MSERGEIYSNLISFHCMCLSSEEQERTKACVESSVCGHRTVTWWLTDTDHAQQLTENCAVEPELGTAACWPQPQVLPNVRRCVQGPTETHRDCTVSNTVNLTHLTLRQCYYSLSCRPLGFALSRSTGRLAQTRGRRQLLFPPSDPNQHSTSDCHLRPGMLRAFKAWPLA